MDQLIQKLIDLVQQASPQPWRIGMRQVYVGAWQDIIVGVISLVLAIVLIVIVVRKHEDWDEFVSAMAGALAVCLFILSLVLFVDASGLLANPEYFAIYKLMGLVK